MENHNNDLMGEFTPIPQVTNEEILSSLYDPENILMKTEIKNIPAIAGLLTLGSFLEMVGLTASEEDENDLLDPSAVVTNYVHISSICAVSKDRKGRKEAIEGVIGIYNKKTEETKKNEDTGLL